MTEQPTAVDIARRLADVCERHAVAYAIGGALALGFYAVPRATVDVDLNVFLSPERDFPRILGLLAEAGFEGSVDGESLRLQALAEGAFRGRIAGLRVDIFVPAIDYYADLATRCRQVSLLGRPAWILSAEDLVVLKMMFFRRKDLADVESILRDQGARLDLAFVRDALAKLVGSEDERIATLAEIEVEVLRS